MSVCLIMSGTGMTQELEALAFEDSQGVELTDEEAEESARAYDIAQVVLKTEPTASLQNRMTKMLVPVLAGGEGSNEARRRRQTRRTPRRTCSEIHPACSVLGRPSRMPRSPHASR